MSFIDEERLLQLCFNIFPNVKTVLHYLVDSTLVDINNLSSLFVMVDKAILK
jgi:hypothetical protein